MMWYGFQAACIQVSLQGPGGSRCRTKYFGHLKHGGTLICLFHSGFVRKNDGRGERIRRIIASTPLGNRDYEQGDTLYLNHEFVHIFTSEEKIRSELEKSGFYISQINMNPTSCKGSAVCVKNNSS